MRLHSLERRRVALLAAGALEGAERERALAHAADCPACARELAELRQALGQALADPALSAELPVAPEVLARSVLARLERAPERAPLRPGWGWTPAAAIAALLALVALGGSLLRPRPQPATRLAVSQAALGRLERTVAREQAVRYLNEAQDVLVTVAASPRACQRRSQRVDVAEEARRSRELLARRALLVDVGLEAVPSAVPVLRDVGEMLHEVALLEPCARAQDLEAIHDEIGRRRLLMKIGLMTRELAG